MKFFLNILSTVAPKVFGSLKNAYQNVTKGKDNDNSYRYNEFTQNFSGGAKPLTKPEATKILGLKEGSHPSPHDIMIKFDKLFDINRPKNGGSIYIQAKIFHAKELLMKDYDPILNKSIHENAKNTNE